MSLFPDTKTNKKKIHSQIIAKYLILAWINLPVIKVSFTFTLELNNQTNNLRNINFIN